MIKPFLRYFFGALFIFVLSKYEVFAGDTLKIMHYNTLNYGISLPKNCPGLLTFKKHNYLRDILKYERPDVLGMVKLDSSMQFVGDTIIDKVLDSVCYHCYSHATLTNHTGYNKLDALFYRNDKLAFISTATTYAGDDSISDINLHKFYYKAPDLATTHDTQFINFIVIHLISGKTNGIIRANDILGVVKYLYKNDTILNNYIAMGDFNSQSSTEGDYQYLTAPSDTNFKFYDPIYQNKDWKKNELAYAKYLSQSTRILTLNDCGSPGGLKDVYDHILVTRSIMLGLDSIKYIPNSYTVVGQDGKHINKSLIDTPLNTSVPPYILNDLYLMSNHLPVTVQLVIGKRSILNGIESATYSSKNIKTHLSLSNQQLLIKLQNNDLLLDANAVVELWTVSGTKIFSVKTRISEINNYKLNSSTLKEGTYLLRIISERGISKTIKVVTAP